MECIVVKNLFCPNDGVPCHTNFSFKSPIYCVLSAYAISVLLRESFSVPTSSKLFPTFSSIRFSVPSLMLRYLIHLELNFEQDNRYDQSSFSYMQPFSLTSPVWCLFSIVCIFGLFVKHLVSVVCKIMSGTSIPLFNVSVQWYFSYYSLAVQLKSQVELPPAVILLFRIDK